MQKHNMTIEALTKTENKIYQLNGLCLQIKEIADKMGIAYETAKSHMKNIKIKLGLQKDKEVTAHFWCNLVGENMDEVKKQIMASLLLIIFVFLVPIDTEQRRANRTRLEKRRTIICRRNDFIV